MDPLSLGASAAGKIGSAVAASYARGPDERRQTYRRFQEAVVVYVMQIRDSRISPEVMGLAPDQRKPYVDALVQATTELAKALYEVRLVGNPGPQAAAEALREAIANSFDAAASRREELTKDEVATYTRAMESFTDACRRDLWYQPPWWQIWRASWWQARRHRNARTATSQPVQVSGGAIQAVRAPGGVVFGTIGAQVGHGVQTNYFHSVVFDRVKRADAPETLKSPVVEPPAITSPRAADGSGEGDDPQGGPGVAGSGG